MTENSSPTPPAEGTAGRRTLDYLALALVVVAAVLLLSGILFQIATADARGEDGGAMLQRLGQAANPFIAALAVATAVLVVQERHEGRVRQAGSGAALGIATVLNLAVALLALSGVVDDLTRQLPVLFKAGTVLGRLATVGLSGVGIWVAATAPPARRPLTPEVPPDQRTSSTL